MNKSQYERFPYYLRATDDVLSLTKQLPSDYVEYGGTVARGDNDKDCSMGCLARLVVSGAGAMADWHMCINPAAPRHGLVTHKHQAGKGCFVAPELADSWRDADDRRPSRDVRRAMVVGRRWWQDKSK